MCGHKELTANSPIMSLQDDCRGIVILLRLLGFHKVVSLFHSPISCISQNKSFSVVAALDFGNSSRKVYSLLRCQRSLLFNTKCLR